MTITILLVGAFVLLLLAAFGVGMPRMALGWLGLALWCLTHVLGRALLIAALAFAPMLALPPEAQAGPMGCTGFAELEPFDFEQISVSSTAVGFTATKYAPAGTRPADMAVVNVETNPVRYLDHGLNPTASVGQPIAATSGIYVCGASIMSRIRFIRQTSDATISVSYYRAAQ